MEKTGFIIMLRYLDPLKKVKTRCHPDVFETIEEAQEQQGIMATEAPKLMTWVCEVPLVDYRPRLVQVQ